jgi:energy-coupling factor transporter ATP-binding protein EcfA2
MVESFSADEPVRLLAALCDLVAERVPAEREINGGFQSRGQAAEKRFAAAERELTERYQGDRTAAETEYAALRRQVVEKFEAEHGAAATQYAEVRDEILARFEAAELAAEQERQDAQWEATTIAEAAKGGSGLELPDIQAELDTRWHELQAIGRQAVELLRRRGQWRYYPDPAFGGSLLERHPAQRFIKAQQLAREQYRALAALKVPRFFNGLWPMMVLFLFLWGLLAIPAGYLLGWRDWQWVAASGGGAFAVFLVLLLWLHRLARRHSTQAYLPLRRTLLEAGADRPAVLETAKNDCRRLHAAIAARHKAEIKKTEERFATVTAELAAAKQQELRQADETYQPRLAAMIAERDETLARADAKYPPLLVALDGGQATASQALTRQHDEEIAANQRQYQQQQAEMADRWQTGLRRFQAAAERIAAGCDRLFPPWDAPAWRHWTPPAEIPPAIRFGHGAVELARIKGGMPEDERLRPPSSEFTLPLLLPFPQRSLLLLKAAGDGRARAVQAVQAIMLRMLTAMPPGKLRFTILDPVGLGENFSAFMHLADYDEQLIASRIWTDTAHIEQRLANLTDHMENVIQVYLRNEFQSIEEYNRSAGEMAEPYRVLVVADFPANFSEAAAHRLKSIVTSGARCGVFTLLAVDTKLPSPRQFHLADLEPDAMVLAWNEGRFHWQHADYGPVPATLEEPPPAERFTEIVRAVGREVKDVSRVEVPFECAAPDEPDWWTADSRGGIDVPLGRAGAMKLQHLDLGKGTSQHVLISGKTGAGKSTLLHVLITNLALRYSPDEIALYLVDFKKGVEFKAYARFGLPHARVVAVESEREFGLSVLQHLDGELRRRGDLFRTLGVQDLKGYRTSQPEARLPRILLVVDEFQELFVDDDRIAQEAALLLDRLVRQGRAFGIHVLLGSQTLGGAYSLARSTIGQMAVRIALQCSEADAHLILSEENTAARLLTRPGEAIYNDANGIYEGNHPFQVVWLSDSLRDEYLGRIAALAKQRKYAGPPAIVFEGNVLSDLSENRQLRELLAAGRWPEAAAGPRAWLGSAVAIAEPTSAVFLRQSGANLLLVGHREEAALGVMTAAMLSLAAQHPPCDPRPGGGAQFYVLDGTRPDAPEAGFWRRVAPVLPHAVKVSLVRDAGEMLAEIAAEVARRQQEALDKAPPVYLLIYNVGRFRDLRKEDEFSFGSDDGRPPSPAKQFATILRDGPALGIHTLVWCDSYTTLGRIVDRQGLRDFEMRVLFQMNPTDSSNLMDTPDAARLGIHRAIYYDDAQGRMEKFRPYGLPGDDWLAWVRGQLQGRRAANC